MSEQEDKKSAAEELKTFGDNVAYIYDKYLAVKRLAQALDGQSPAAPFPQGVGVIHVDIEYFVGNFRHTARIEHVNRVGDVSALLERETEKLVDSLRTLAWGAQNVSAQILAACETAQYNARARQAGDAG